MPGWLAEFLYVLSLSKRTQFALFIGVCSFFTIHMLGEHLVANFELQGPYKALESAISEKMLRKYDKAALIAWLSFWGLALKYYLKDRKRFW